MAWLFKRKSGRIRKRLYCTKIVEKTRNTKETQISLKFNPKGKGEYKISTGLKFFDHMLEQFAYHGNFDLVHFLVSKGANPNTVNQKGDSPLIQAVFVNRYDIVMYLLFVGAEPNLRNLLGNTALHYASSFGNLETVKVLVANGADINSQNELQETPLFIASKNGRAKVVEYLLSTRKVDKKLTNFEGLYPLDIALKNHHEEIVNMLSK